MNKDNKTAVTMLIMVAAMFALAFAAFPLYSIFCKATGYGGTPKVALHEFKSTGTRHMIVRFNADVAPDLPWDFHPAQKQVELVTGENKLIYYMAKNTSSKPITGVASYNISPEEAGAYFNKIQCFCFTTQTLQPGEEKKMPVTFYIDPGIEKNLDLKGITTITLSYTFFRAPQ